MVNFANINTDAGLKELNTYLADKSYIVGYQATQADVTAYKTVGKAPDATKYAHVSRWFNHITEFPEEERSKLTAAELPASSAAPAKDEDEIDLFGDDDEADAAYEEELKKRVEAANAAKGGKVKKDVVAKSSLLLDVKPWDDETPMDKLEECVRSIEMEGLTWGASKLVAVGYGIKKLSIAAVVVDELVSVDDLEEKITAFEDYVQSMDVAAFNKI